LPQAACGCIAGIDEGLFALLQCLLVVRLKPVAWHEYFAAYLKCGRVALVHELQRHSVDRSDIVCDVLTRRSVTPGGPTDQLPLFVQQAYSCAVQFRFGGVLDIGTNLQIESLRHAAMKIIQFIFRERVIQRQHREDVVNGAERLDGLGTHTLCRRIGGYQLGMCLFKILQFANQPVVLCVRHFRLIEHVILIVVVPDLGLIWLRSESTFFMVAAEAVISGDTDALDQATRVLC